MTSVAFPFTVTWTGALTAAKGLDGKGWPGSTLAVTGPRPVAKSDKISPCVAGLATVTREKSLEWVMAGPDGSIVTSGRAIGITWAIHRTVPPPLRWRFAGSSVMEAFRCVTTPGAAAATDICPRAPRNAPVPPVITKLPPAAAVGDPGGASPAGNPLSHNGPDRGTVALQEFEGGHAHSLPHSVRDCLTRRRRRSQNEGRHGVGVSPLHWLAIDGHNVGDTFNPVEISRDGCWRSDVGIRRILGNVCGVLEVHRRCLSGRSVESQAARLGPN